MGENFHADGLDQTMLNCIDNSGAAVVECVNVLKKKRPATVGTQIHPCLFHMDAEYLLMSVIGGQ